jgi:acyl-CoA dehydrogenase
MTNALQRLQTHVLPVAAAFADEVDAQARFPAETFAALKAHGLMGVLIDPAYGGEGLALAEVVDLCAALGQVCASSALIYAMHHIKVSSLVQHSHGSAWHEALMTQVAKAQWLLGSATTEGGVGGDVRTSICAIERDSDAPDAWFTLQKEATVISYGEQADAILLTARKDAQSPPSDQVLAVVERSQMSLVKQSDWNTLGMRGTCSYGFKLGVRAPVCQIFEVPFAQISAHSMLAHSHILWAAVWYGVAAEAAARAQAFLKAETRRLAAQAPGATRLAQVLCALQAMKSLISNAVTRLQAAQKNADQLDTAAFLLDMNALKINASAAVVDVVNQAMWVCGMQGYRNGTPYSLGRLLRDAQSSVVMINNDRILSNMAQLVLMSRVHALISHPDL